MQKGLTASRPFKPRTLTELVWSQQSVAGQPLRCVAVDANGWVNADAIHHMFKALASDADLEYVMIYGTIVKIHRSGQGAKGGSLSGDRVLSRKHNQCPAVDMQY